jgi:Prokaryotic lipoprotein-attachment site
MVDSQHSVAMRRIGPARGAPFTLLLSLIWVAVLCNIAACGQKGPLMLPKSTTPAASAPAR